MSLLPVLVAKRVCLPTMQETMDCSARPLHKVYNSRFRKKIMSDQHVPTTILASFYDSSKTRPHPGYN